MFVYTNNALKIILFRDLLNWFILPCLVGYMGYLVWRPLKNYVCLSAEVKLR